MSRSVGHSLPSVADGSLPLSPTTVQPKVPSKVWEQLKHYQENLIYLPLTPSDSRTNISTPDQHDMPHYEDIDITTPDNVNIKGYYIQFNIIQLDGSAKASPYTLLYCHGNAGNIGQRLPIAKILHLGCKLNIFMLEYRGYGRSEGRPDEKGLKIDSQAALDWIISRPELIDTKIVLFGQSMGGAVAIDLASRNPERISAMIIENSFLSLPKLMPHVSPLLRMASFLLHQIWDSEAAIKRISCGIPILLLSGGKDEVIPQQHMVELLKAVRSARYKSITSGLDFGADSAPIDRRRSSSADAPRRSTNIRISQVQETIAGSQASINSTSSNQKGLVGFLLKKSAKKTVVVEPIPMKLGRDIPHAYGVYWTEFPNGGHSNTCTESGYFEAIRKFLKDSL